MQRIITPTIIRGTLLAPASKSVAQRAIAIAALAPGISDIHFAGNCDDVIAAIDVCRRLGAGIDKNGEVLIIRGGITAPSDTLDCGEAGLGIRMFSAIAATLNEKVVLTGRGSLLKRPMDMIEQSMKALGIDCTTQNGLLPVTVSGPIPGGMAKIDGSVSSQVLTGILIAAPYALKPLHIEVSNLKSIPYIDITIQTMKTFGVNVAHQNYEEFFIDAPQKYIPASFIVEGDWSGAAFMLVAGAIAGEIRIENLKSDSTQADRAIIEALLKSNADVIVGQNYVSVKKRELKSFEFDATHCPDLFPPLVALAANCKGVSVIKGVSRLAVKESNRALTLQGEFGVLGVDIKFENDNMFVEGSKIRGGEVFAHHDHRIAMASAVAGITSEQNVIVNNAEAVAKSYPRFYDDLEAVSHKV